MCSMADFPHKRRVAGVGESDGVLYVVSGLGKSNTLYTQFLRGFFLACCYTFSNQLAAVTLKLNMTAESPAWEQVGAQSQDNLVRRWHVHKSRAYIIVQFSGEHIRGTVYVVTSADLSCQVLGWP